MNFSPRAPGVSLVDSSEPPPPGQKDLLLNSLRPGANVDLVVNRDHVHELADVRSSLLHEVKNRRLILAQTTPPLSRAHVGREIEVTFLLHMNDVPGGRWLRAGYTTELLEITPNYRLGPDLVETVLVVDMPRKLDQNSVRMHFRVIPPLDYGLRAFLAGANLRDIIEGEMDWFIKLVRHQLWDRDKHPRKMIRELNESVQQLVETVSYKTDNARQAEVTDLSLGGAKLLHPRDWELDHEERLSLVLVWGENVLELEARVVRSGEVEVRGGKNKAYTSVQFLSLSQENRRVLTSLLNEILRRELARRSGLEE